jgi:hypothetical protein
MRRWTASLILVAALAGCAAPQETATAPAAPPMIIVREFRTTSSTRVAIDTSFGFSLHRGQPGVPLSQRALSVSRAAAFDIADAATERLRQAGYNAVHGDTRGPEPTGKAIIVVGTLRNVDEGHRRRVGAENAAVAADVEIDYWAPGMQPLNALHIDSAQLGSDGVAGGNAAAVNVAAARVGREIARVAIAAAQRVDLPRR